MTLYAFKYTIGISTSGVVPMTPKVMRHHREVPAQDRRQHSAFLLCYKICALQASASLH